MCIRDRANMAEGKDAWRDSTRVAPHNAYSSTAVSYTHLDVYKRQVKWWKNLKSTTPIFLQAK